MKQKVDNYAIVRNLLKWEKEGDYYLISLILRKKDRATTFGNKNNSARIIKNFTVFSLEEYDKREREIKSLCDKYYCRAGIAMNKKNEEQVTLELLSDVVDRVKSKNWRGINSIMNTVNGKSYPIDKLWLLDCDEQKQFDVANQVLNDPSIQPEGNKILGFVPTYSGYHILTIRFNRHRFDELCIEQGVQIDIHKNNFLALYYPEIPDDIVPLELPEDYGETSS